MQVAHQRPAEAPPRARPAATRRPAQPSPRPACRRGRAWGAAATRACRAWSRRAPRATSRPWNIPIGAWRARAARPPRAALAMMAQTAWKPAGFCACCGRLHRSQLGATDGPRQIRRHSLCLRPGSVGLQASTDLTTVYRAAGGAWEYVQRVSRAADAGATQAAGLAPAELTAANMDRSAALEQLLAGPWRGHEAALLGELQVRRVVQGKGFMERPGLGRAPRCRASRAVGRAAGAGYGH